MKKYLEFVVSHISKSRCGAPRVGTTLSCQRPRAFFLMVQKNPTLAAKTNTQRGCGIRTLYLKEKCSDKLPESINAAVLHIDLQEYLRRKP
jgi:hypothetical protein